MNIKKKEILPNVKIHEKQRKTDKKSCLGKIINYIFEMVRWEDTGGVHQNAHGNKESPVD